MTDWTNYADRAGNPGPVEAKTWTQVTVDELVSRLRPDFPALQLTGIATPITDRPDLAHATISATSRNNNYVCDTEFERLVVSATRALGETDRVAGPVAVERRGGRHQDRRPRR